MSQHFSSRQVSVLSPCYFRRMNKIFFIALLFTSFPFIIFSFIENGGGVPIIEITRREGGEEGNIKDVIKEKVLLQPVQKVATEFEEPVHNRERFSGYVTRQKVRPRTDEPSTRLTGKNYYSKDRSTGKEEDTRLTGKKYYPKDWSSGKEEDRLMTRKEDAETKPGSGVDRLQRRQSLFADFLDKYLSGKPSDGGKQGNKTEKSRKFYWKSIKERENRVDSGALGGKDVQHVGKSFPETADERNQTR